MRFVRNLRAGLAIGRGSGSPSISTRYDGPGINSNKFGGPQFSVGETNYSNSNKGIAFSGTK